MPKEESNLSRRVGLLLLEFDTISQRGYIYLESGEIPKALQDQLSLHWPHIISASGGTGLGLVPELRHWEGTWR